MIETKMHIHGQYTINKGNEGIHREIDEVIYYRDGEVLSDYRAIKKHLLEHLKHDIKTYDGSDVVCDGRVCIEYTSFSNGDTRESSWSTDIDYTWELQLVIQHIDVKSHMSLYLEQSTKGQPQLDHPINVSLVTDKPIVLFSHSFENGRLKRDELAVTEDGPAATWMRRLSRLCCFC